MNSMVGWKVIWLTKADLISRLARRRSTSSDVCLYQTVPVPRVSTSAQYGAMSIRSGLSTSGNGAEVNCLTDLSKDKTPLLLTYIEEKIKILWFIDIKVIY